MKNRKLTKAITAVTVTCTLIAVISAFSSYLLPLYLSYKLNKDIRDAGSVGIIGGADGPTAIYLSGQISSHWVTVIFAALAILGVIYLIAVKNSVKKS
ncbi:Na+-transporting oxaloacetate decarboxylase beta subunit [Proteiniborus ethanoligenes]|jgi:Na+-transporting methylmalonyl-CoA/oxaloacetate decarboxylase beta subunit|uniref:Na+-transporting oxaloacetate decarboxylase beta subunit n=1 Tax=Proteiniborus ethanoligenes TaxID=415015 RepID=A0A1H3NQB6_9FIRM|nr:sodium ion-translocating decarboxylase subunit beta [Proteiniborus ethanoligenes]SDY90953.1 Na+-transporting oxaloacetate decarboxylase beta subunit [Proteiniborus ethanoligenes]